MESDEIARLEHMREAWISLRAIYRRGEVDGFVRVRAEHWRLIEDICHDWDETAKAILEHERSR